MLGVMCMLLIKGEKPYRKIDLKQTEKLKGAELVFPIQRLSISKRVFFFFTIRLENDVV